MDRAKKKVLLNTGAGKPAGRVSAPQKKMVSKLNLDGRRRGLKLGFLIHDVSRMRRRAFDQLMRPLGITRARWWVIAHLSRQDGMMQTELADRLDVGKASLGNLIDRLEADGWVKRRADPVDKRAKRVYLARNAEQLLGAMMNYERKFNEQALRGLNEEDRDSLVRLLSLIKQSLSNVVPADSLPDVD